MILDIFTNIREKLPATKMIYPTFCYSVGIMNSLLHFFLPGTYIEPKLKIISSH